MCSHVFAARARGRVSGRRGGKVLREKKIDGRQVMGAGGKQGVMRERELDLEGG